MSLWVHPGECGSFAADGPVAALQCAHTQADASIDALNTVAAEAEAEAAAREQSLLRALEAAQADAAALRAQLQDCRSAFAETGAHARDVSERLSAAEADLGAAKHQLAEAAEREAALASRVKAQDLELAACRACSADLREDNARLRAEVAALQVCPCSPVMTSAYLSLTELRLVFFLSLASSSVRPGVSLCPALAVTCTATLEMVRPSSCSLCSRPLSWPRFCDRCSLQ